VGKRQEGDEELQEDIDTDRVAEGNRTRLEKTRKVLEDTWTVDDEDPNT
jgi:hypothetical protein